MQRHRLLLVLLAATALTPAAAHADPVPTSAFAPIAGSGGCIVAGLVATPVCEHAESSSTQTRVLQLSPDQRQLLLVTGGTEINGGEEGTNAIVAYDRDAATGALTLASCVSNDGGDDRLGSDGACADGDGLSGVNAIAMTADGKALFATAGGSSSLVWFDRDPATGKLTQAGCLKNFAWPGERCRTAAMLGGASGVAVNGDGTLVFVTAARTGSVTTFRRDPATNTLERVSCVSDNGSDGLCTDGTGLRGAGAVTTSADGSSVIVLGIRSDAVTSYAVDPVTGKLTMRQCLSAKAQAGSACVKVASLSSATGMQLTAGGDELVVGGPQAVTVLTRSADGSLAKGSCTSYVEPAETDPGVEEDDDAEASAAQAGDDDGCAKIAGFDASTIALSADGKVLFTSGWNGTFILRRSATGAPFELHACDRGDAGNPSCSVRSTDNAYLGQMATTADGRFLYRAESDIVRAYRTSTAVAASASVRRSGVVTTTIGCPAAHRTPCAGSVTHDGLAAPASFRVAAGTTRRLTLRLRTHTARSFRSGRVGALTVRVSDRSRTTRSTQARLRLRPAR